MCSDIIDKVVKQQARLNHVAMMACPKCGYAYSKAIDTNRAKTMTEVRRNRSCLKCSSQFITYEIIASDYAMLQSFRRWTKEESQRIVDTQEVK
jgi:transcriptional regulator NrdR family protein